MKKWPEIPKDRAELLLPELERAKHTTGRELLSQYLNNEQIGRAEAVVAKCCDCMGYYADGLLDCENPTCPLYPWMPYRKAPKKKGKGRTCPQCGAPWNIRHNRCTANCDRFEKD
jgi:hypothetical protein